MPPTEEHRAIREQARRFADETIRPVAAELDRTEGFRPTSTPGWRNSVCSASQCQSATAAPADTCPCPGDGGAGARLRLDRRPVRLGRAGGLAAQRARQRRAEGRCLGPLLRAERRCAYAITEAGGRLRRGRDPDHGEPTGTAGGSTAPSCGSTTRRYRLRGRAGAHRRGAGLRGMCVFLVERDAGRSRSAPRFVRWASAPRRSARSGSTTCAARGRPAWPRGRGFHMMMSVLDKGRIGSPRSPLAFCGAARGGRRLRPDAAAVRPSIAEFQGCSGCSPTWPRTRGCAPPGPRGGRAARPGSARRWHASIAKCFASDAAVQHASTAVQIFGGSGYIRGFEVERLYRDAKVTQIYEGTNQIQRNLIARHVLGQ